MHPTSHPRAVLGLMLAAGALALAAPSRGHAPPAAWGQAASPWAGSVCVQRVSVSSSGQQGDRESRLPSLSDDGQRVTFGSLADNLVAGDINGNYDIHLHDRRTSQTRLVGYSVDGVLDGTFGAGDAFLAGDGQTVAYVARISAAAPGAATVCSQRGNIVARECVLLYDLAAGTLEVMDLRPDGQRGNAYSRWPALSHTGGVVAFWSTSSDLVAADTNGASDVFDRDRAASATTRVSLTTFGGQGVGASGDVGFPGGDAVAISRNGRYVAFVSAAANLSSGDTNGALDVILRDRPARVTERVSLGNGGAQGNGASVLGARQAISDDGRFVVFASNASNLVPGDTNGRMDVFLRDRGAGTTERVSVPDAGGQGSGDSGPAAAISADGRYVAFASAATNLVSGDTNGAVDIFVRDRTAGRTVRVSLGTGGAQANAASGHQVWEGLSMAAGGLTVAFRSAASNLVAGDTNGAADVFVAEPCAPLPTPTATAQAYPGPTNTATSPPTSTVTAQPTATRTATATPTSTRPAYPGPATPTAPPFLASCVCRVVQQRVPPVVIDDALANPARYYGWQYPLDPGKPPGPANPPRTCLTLQNVNVDYHPTWNRPIWRVGCP